jgi:hypothetical protein
MRLGLISEMSAAIRAKLFSGAFPVYCYMYTLRQFMRMNGVSGQDVEQFVAALSGKGLSVREIEQLAHHLRSCSSSSILPPSSSDLPVQLSLVETPG